ncbi:MAG: hypothetical protein MMC33_007074 [Icmadophila ericetorum]|nr:hypothetical protein [Icmadophila ericetorum]
MDRSAQFLRLRPLLKSCFNSQRSHISSPRCNTGLCINLRPNQSSIHCRLLSSTSPRLAGTASSSLELNLPIFSPPKASPSPAFEQKHSGGPSRLASLSDAIGSTQQANQRRNERLSKPLSDNSIADDVSTGATPPHHLHIYATKHNTHITLTRPNRNPIISVSCGNIGFKKGARGTYDAAYQLGAYVFGRIQEQGLLTKIGKLELIMRGFGPGRDALQKVLLGTEGQMLRPRVIRVVDATRLKFGGTRSPKPRRLG